MEAFEATVKGRYITLEGYECELPSERKLLIIHMFSGLGTVRVDSRDNQSLRLGLFQKCDVECNIDFSLLHDHVAHYLIVSGILVQFGPFLGLFGKSRSSSPKQSLGETRGLLKLQGLGGVNPLTHSKSET
ncbi:hypothetical protein J6590_037274 [Homalodisca vitripennis]|nr:hypothetical protein J6590_037274 [Homalodisca vitripennis]